MESRFVVTARLERLEGPDGTAAWAVGEPDWPVVFVQHGLGSRKERPLELALRLADAGFRAVSVDAPCHGDRRDSQTRRILEDSRHPDFLPLLFQVVARGADELATIADALGASTWAVTGHSLGGRIALRAARRFPQVWAVAAIGTPLGPDARPPGLPFDLPPESLALLDEDDPLLHADALWPRPVLLLHGADDPKAPPSGGRLLAQALAARYASDPARLRHVEAPGVGHELHPDFAAAVADFLTRHRAP